MNRWLYEALADYREREVILRRFFKDETQVAIANDLGISHSGLPH